MGTWQTELKEQLRLAAPVVLIQVGLMTMGIVDTVMMGRVSATQFAAVGLGDAMAFMVFAFGMGTIVGFDAIFSQAFGAKDEDAFGVGVRRAVVFSLLISVPLIGAIWAFPPILTLLGQPDSIVPIASSYMRIVAFGTPGFLLFVAVRHALQARELLAPIVWTIVLANLLNVVLDWALIFGHLGLPRLEAVGSAWATTICRVIMSIGLVIMSWKHLRPYLTNWGERAFELRPLLRMAKLGAPVGFQFVGEMGAFTLVGLWAGWMGDLTLAGHQVSLKLASLTFMVPLGISIAASVRVGHAIGRNDQKGMRSAMKVSLGLGAAVMAVFGVVLVIFPVQLSTLFIEDPEVVAIAAVLIPVAGFFQIFDGVQVVAVGILRGVADTLIPGILQTVGFWVIGVPASYYLAFTREMGPVGLWWGLVIGLAAVSVIQVTRVFQQARRSQQRFEVEGS